MKNLKLFALEQELNTLRGTDNAEAVLAFAGKLDKYVGLSDILTISVRAAQVLETTGDLEAVNADLANVLTMVQLREQEIEEYVTSVTPFYAEDEVKALVGLRFEVMSSVYYYLSQTEEEVMYEQLRVLENAARAVDKILDKTGRALTRRVTRRIDKIESVGYLKTVSDCKIDIVNVINKHLQGFPEYVTHAEELDPDLALGDQFTFLDFETEIGTIPASTAQARKYVDLQDIHL